jgi:hypothetical protein
MSSSKGIRKVFRGCQLPKKRRDMTVSTKRIRSVLLLHRQYTTKRGAWFDSDSPLWGKGKYGLYSPMIFISTRFLRIPSNSP